MKQVLTECFTAQDSSLLVRSVALGDQSKLILTLCEEQKKSRTNAAGQWCNCLLLILAADGQMFMATEAKKVFSAPEERNALGMVGCYAPPELRDSLASVESITISSLRDYSPGERTLA